ncbi:hypothetical protein [Streptomyces odontomachi]|uniref:hypothetical protein n=1 Tax=Streptomyces odontomachi TaxID=2944940 RepID=UPI00210C1713|nr:hypothetical protein [Streptomyces sp. ODS25]
MPRPTATQFAYGSLTVVLCTLAMLLLSQTTSGVGVAVIAVVALGLGLLVALTAPSAQGSDDSAQPDPRAAKTAPGADPQARTSGPVDGGGSTRPADGVRHTAHARRGHGRRVRVH